MMDEDSDEEEGEYGTPEGDFARRLSAACAPDDCVYDWVVAFVCIPCAGTACDVLGAGMRTHARRMHGV